jgi:beta-lactamase class A
MGSDTVIYIPNFIKTGSGTQNVIGDTQSGWRSRKLIVVVVIDPQDNKSHNKMACTSPSRYLQSAC